MIRSLVAVFSTSLAFTVACSSSSPQVLFQPKPECEGSAVVPYMGTFPQVMNSIEIGTPADGFDLDGKGKPENKLGNIASLANNSIVGALASYSVVIPLEMFNLAAVAPTKCVKFAVYLGAFVQDRDADMSKDSVSGGDCNDNDAAIHPGVTEVVGNFKDDDCDGIADETESPPTPSTDTMDRDGDGYSMAEGDCDDTDPMVHPGMPEICGDGKDNDCDGVADRSHDASGNVTACSPFFATADIPLNPVSFTSGTTPAVVFDNGTIGSDMQLSAGPGVFSIDVPITGGITLDLTITGAQILGTVNSDGTIANGKLGGVISVQTMDKVTGINESAIHLTAQDSLLDAMFANLLGTLLALPHASPSVLAKYPGCMTPDIDVDGDGLEAFCSSNPNATNPRADVCIDGDGTVVMSTYDGSGNILTHCVDAVDSHGKPRFVDGVSSELNFTTTRIAKIQPPISQ
jgi:hypothetical protein